MQAAGFEAGGASPATSETFSSTSATHRYMEGIITFLNDVSPSSDFISLSFGSIGQADNTSKRVAANGDTSQIKPSNGFIINPTIFYTGGGTLSDWTLINMARYELLV
jgi:hypothetical protein